MKLDRDPKSPFLGWLGENELAPICFLLAATCCTPCLIGDACLAPSSRGGVVGAYFKCWFQPWSPYGPCVYCCCWEDTYPAWLKQQEGHLQSGSNATATST